jgi:archaetidylinositol phosphate synthase
MVLDSRRSSVDFIMDPMAIAFSKVDPNVISGISLVLAGMAGLIIYLSPNYWQLFLPLATVLVLLSGFFDGLDGKVARLIGQSSRRGDFIDHVFDRYADIFMIGAIAVSAWCNPYVGIMAIIGVMLTSYMGTQAQALGCGRNYGGLLGRADRLLVLMVAPLFQFVMVAAGTTAFSFGSFHLTFFEIAMLWFGVVGNITAVQRARAIWKSVR